MAGERHITLAEELGWGWAREVVSYPFEAQPGECRAASLRLTGPAGPLAVQLSDVELHPGTEFVRRGRVAFLVDELQPLQARNYTLAFGPEAPAAAGPAADLQVTRRPDQAELATSAFGVRVPLGEKEFAEPAAADTVPGPIAALRLADGTWFGGSRLYGERHVKSWSARLVDAGPVFARAESVYTYADGGTLTVTVRLNAADSAAQVDMVCRGAASLADGWRLLLNGGVAIREGVALSGARYLAKEVPAVLKGADAPACYLNPWSGDGWFPDSPSVLRLKLADRADELFLSVRDPGAWVEPPLDAPWLNFARWTVDMIGPVMWHGWQSKRIPVTTDGTGVALTMNLLPGVRRWTVGQGTDPARLLAVFRSQATGEWTPLPRLDQVKDMVLAWEDKTPQPCLFATAADLEAKAAGNPKAYADLTSRETLLERLDKLGALDYMRTIMDVAARYDALVDSPALSEHELRLVRARTAYLAYLVADPTHWSYERGYCSGNPNMTVSRYANLGILALALRDHPMGPVWAGYARDWMVRWLAEVTDASGVWPESAHYARVSWADFVVFALAARQAGLHDYFTDPKFRAMALYYEKEFMPPHPGRDSAGGAGAPPHPRVTALYGRGTRMDAWGLGGLLASATAATDPEFSKIMQWSWRGSGYSEMFSHSTAGATSLLLDRSLPAQVPDWRSERLPHRGYLLRSQVGTPGENCLLWITEPPRSPDGEIWPPDVGGIANWYALGVPLAGTFQRAPETCHPLTVNRVTLATNWDPAAGQPVRGGGLVTQPEHRAFAAFAGLDYADVLFRVPAIADHWIAVPPDLPAFPKRDGEGRVPYAWRRQLLLVADPAADGANYLVLRDTVTGGQPTQWQFWFVSDKIGTPAEVADRAAFLQDKPGPAKAPCRPLAGDRFVALGQFGVDVDVFVVSPQGTPRHTLRWGTSQGAYGVGKAVPDYLDLLHLQLPGDGAYVVALVPRPASGPAPTFERLADGRVVRIAGPWGTDTCFLVAEPGEAAAGETRFAGVSGVVQERPGGVSLVLGAAGTVRCGNAFLQASGACRLTRPAADRLVLEAAGGAAREQALDVTLAVPGNWNPETLPAGAVVEQTKAPTWAVRLPPGVGQISFRAK